MLRSKDNYNMLMSLLGEHMKNKYNYDIRKDDIHIMTNIMDKLTYDIPKERDETMEQYTEKINRMVLNHFINFKVHSFQQRNQPPQQPQQPQQVQQIQSHQPTQQQTPEQLLQERNEFQPSSQRLPPPIETRTGSSSSLPPPIETRQPRESAQISESVQRSVPTIQIDHGNMNGVIEDNIVSQLKQNNKILEYENNKMLKNQTMLTNEKNHYLNLLKEKENEIMMLKSKMASHNIDSGNVSKIIVNSDNNSQFHNGAFLYKFNYQNLYKIVLRSGYIECYNNFNILSHNNTLIIKESEKEIVIQISDGNYNINGLISVLEDKINSKCSQTYMLQYDEVVNKIYIKAEKEFTIMSSMLSDILGFDGIKEGDNVYESDFSSKLHKNHSCFVRIKADDKNIGMVESTNDGIKTVFAVMYDTEERNMFVPNEEFSSKFDTPVNLETLSIEIITDNAIYVDSDIFFQFMFDFYYS